MSYFNTEKLEETRKSDIKNGKMDRSLKGAAQ